MIRNETSLWKERIRAVMQVFAHVVAAHALRAFYGAATSIPEGFHGIRKGTLLVSNHQSMVDPFLVTAHIPMRLFLRLLPIYFPVSHEYYSRWYLKPFLRIVGGYDIGGTKKEKLRGLIHTRDLLRQGRTVFLFPEGRINRENMGDFQRGIEFFVKDSHGVVFVNNQASRMRWSILTSDRPLLKFSEVFVFDQGGVSAGDLKKFLEQL